MASLFPLFMLCAAAFIAMGAYKDALIIFGVFVGLWLAGVLFDFLTEILDR